MQNQVIQVTTYELRASPEEYSRAAQALSERVRTEGPEGLLRYSFYVDAEGGKASGVLVYRDAATWLGQHDFVPTLAEYAAFQQTVSLAGLRFFGGVTAEMTEWLDARGVDYELGGSLAAGFER